MQPTLTPWQEACQTLDWEKMSSLLVDGVHPDAPLETLLGQNQPLFDTVLIKALYQGNNNLVKKLIKAGACVNYRDTQGMTPLHHCMRRGVSTSLAEILLDHGALIDAQSAQQQTALSLAAQQGLKEFVDILLGYGADPDLRIDGDNTALMISCSLRWESICHTLLDHGANPSLLDPQGRTCLQRGRSMSQALRDRMVSCAQAFELGATTPQIRAANQGRRI